MYDFVTQWGPLWGTVAAIGQILGFMVVLLLSLAFLLLMDRKVWAAVGMRKGPNVVGAFGLLQSFADFLKFVLKEIVVPAGADRPLFLLAPVLTFVLAFIAWAVMPVAPGWVISDINVGILYIFAISSLGVYGIIIGGWASNSKYPFLGSLRSAAQMVSYEVSIGFVIVTILVMAGTMNLSEIVASQGGGFWNWHVLSLDMLPWPAFLITIPMFVIFFVSALAETNRPPFDLPEAEAELVAGYQVEYSSTPYLLFMIGEYLNIVLMCSLMTVLFLGGWHAPVDIAPFTWVPPVFWFALKVLFFFFLFAMVKALVPRYRYDQLMRLGWKIFLPTSLAAVAVMGGVVVYTNAGAAG
ncbi:MAG: NADH-quinone oxidoreductase subunit NuoH [Pseudomonadota bacterium]